ncbi:polysaccharide export protein EpsE [Aquabacterium sp.]|jgi:polysaccharide export outer membrane protein|uniref:polysaccharide export protein EpsE n=1 Tax=Aquabacterium sp. TaxID=1872578 RepID=UPI0025BAA618|nr:polysaccharide export protein EpsE [Aquabacterium sp.]
MKWMRVVARWCLATMLLGYGLMAQAASSADYVLGVGDVVRITVYQNPDLSLETRINEGGTVSYPLLGTVKLGGLSITDAEKKIATGLKDGNYLKQPQVTMLLMSGKSNQVSVLGLVNRPGRYPLEAGSSKLSEVLAVAGGIVAGSGSDVVVVSGLRGGKPFRKEIDFPKVFASTGSEDDFGLENGDSIWVDRAPQIYMYGEVQRPGAQILLRDTTLLQALASAGGLTLRGTERGIRIHRRDESGQTKVIQLDMNDKLKANDIIYVKESLF